MGGGLGGMGWDERDGMGKCVAMAFDVDGFCVG